MKVALELQPCAGQRSGVGVYTYELAKRLKNDEDISYIGNVFNPPFSKGKDYAIKGIPFPIWYTSTLPYGVYRRIWDYVPLSYKLFFNNHSDITHFFNYIVPPRIEGHVIDTIHDMCYQLYPETLDPKNLKRITHDIDYSIDRSDLLIAVSENTKQDIINLLNVPSSKIHVIYNGVTPMASKNKLEEVQQRFSFTHPYILYVGNLEPRKNIERLVLAYAKLKKEINIPHQLVLAGQKGWLYDTIFQTVLSKGLQDDVIFTGYISESEKAALYTNASLFAYPSLYEGFGIPILEAMSAGIPVVCSNTSSMPEVAGEAALFVNPLDVDDIASGMFSLLSDEALRATKIALGKIQTTKFSWDKSAEDLGNLYRSMM